MSLAIELLDYRLLMGVAYGEWKQRHAAYLDIRCQIAGGAQVSDVAFAEVRANAERALADLASISHRTADQEEVGVLGI
jgi:cobalamin-dependent methionine synthase I